jgi:23S rRNA (uridine2552-2'-O)-methyltransferase
MKQVQDQYFKRAKKEKYPARSVYKLQEIDEKYKIIKKGHTILDIGCAPGSWSQYILEKIGNGRLLGIDIATTVQISDPRFHFLKRDIFELRKGDIEKYRSAFDLITSDAAPSTTGNKFVDSQASLAIVKRVFQLADDILKPHGSIIAKIFQGEDVNAFINSEKINFSKILFFKPKSSRKESRELFIIAIDRRARSDKEY